MLPIAISGWPLIAEPTVAASSGKLVPTATIVKTNNHVANTKGGSNISRRVNEYCELKTAVLQAQQPAK